MFKFLDYTTFYKKYDEYFNNPDRLTILSKDNDLYLIYPLTKEELDDFKNDINKYYKLYSKIINYKYKSNFTHKIIILLENGIDIDCIIKNYKRLFVSSDYIATTNNKKINIYNTSDNISFGIKSKLKRIERNELNLKNSKIVSYILKNKF